MLNTVDRGIPTLDLLDDNTRASEALLTLTFCATIFGGHVVATSLHT